MCFPHKHRMYLWGKFILNYYDEDMDCQCLCVTVNGIVLDSRLKAVTVFVFCALK